MKLLSGECHRTSLKRSEISCDYFQIGWEGNSFNQIWILPRPGAHFANNFSNNIQMPWKFHFTQIGILTKWSLQNCVHDTTTVLSWASGMCKNLLRSDDQQWNYSKVKFPLNLNCEQKLLLKRAPDPGRVQCEVMYLNYRPISDVASRLMNATAVTTDAYSSSPSRLTCRMIGML